MKKLQTLLIAGVAAGALMAADAHANFIFENIGDTQTIVYDGNIDTNTVDGLFAETDYTLIGISGNSFVFEVVVRNTTDDTIWEDSRVSRIAFDVEPDVTGATATLPWVATLNQSLPNQVGNVDICVQAQTQGACEGGPGGPGINDFQTFQLTLSFDAPPPTQVTLSNFAVRYQSLSSAQLGFSGASGTGTPGNGTKVPEPATLALLGIGLLGAGYMARRRRLEA